MALPSEQLGAIEAERLHSDDDPSLCRLRNGELFDGQHIGGSRLTNHYGSHGPQRNQLTIPRRLRNGVVRMISA